MNGGMNLNNLNIRSEWAELKRSEEKINKIICKFLREKYHDTLAREAKYAYEAEINELIKDSNKPWYEARQEVIDQALVVYDDFAEEVFGRFDEEVIPNSDRFRKSLYSVIIEQTIPDDIKEKMSREIKKQLLQVKQFEWTPGRKIAMGKRAANTYNNIYKIMTEYTDSEGKVIKDRMMISEVRESDFKERIKDYFYIYLNKVSFKQMPKSIQADITRKGLLNELEDAFLSNSDNRQVLAEYIASELFDTSIYSFTSAEFGSGDRKQYDFHVATDGRGYVKDTNIPKRFDMFYDSKLTVESVGAELKNYVITSQEVIDILSGSITPHRDLLAYNRRHSEDNELLLEYLLDLYQSRLYYLIDKENKEIYSLSYLVEQDKLKMDTRGLRLNEAALLNNKYQILYAKAVHK